MSWEFRKKTLVCGCCGDWFRTWKMYENQWQDYWYGICKKCQRDEEEREKKEFNKIFMKFRDSLSDENKKKFAELSKEKKEHIVKSAIAEGKISYTIK